MTAEEYVVNELHETKEKLHDLKMELNCQAQENEELKNKIRELEKELQSKTDFFKKLLKELEVKNKDGRYITAYGCLWKDSSEELYNEALNYLEPQEEQEEE